MLFKTICFRIVARMFGGVTLLNQGRQGGSGGFICDSQIVNLDSNLKLSKNSPEELSGRIFPANRDQKERRSQKATWKS